MNILLIPIDSKIPNLALMKVSSYYKSRGDNVGFNIKNPDKVYVSCIFSKNLYQAIGIQRYYPNSEFHLGGSALYQPNSLPYEMDYIMPDYDLYGVDYSLGFTTRGCPNKCPFCIVPKLEGEFREYQPMSLFHDKRFDKMILWDNNFLASKLLKEKFSYIKEYGLKISLNQGLDATLLTPEIANTLIELKLWNLKFSNQCYYFAWDLMEKEKRVLDGLHLMVDSGLHPSKMMIYMLTGFNTTHEQDMYRFNKLQEMKIDPFVMIYNNRRDDGWIRNFARWVNKRIYRVCKWEDYKK